MGERRRRQAPIHAGDKASADQAQAALEAEGHAAGRATTGGPLLKLPRSSTLVLRRSGTVRTPAFAFYKSKWDVTRGGGFRSKHTPHMPRTLKMRIAVMWSDPMAALGNIGGRC